MSSSSTRAGRKSNRNNLEKDKGKSKRHAGRQQRRDVKMKINSDTFPEHRLLLEPTFKLDFHNFISFVCNLAVCPCRVGIQMIRVSPRCLRTTVAPCLTALPPAATCTTTITMFVAAECRVRFHDMTYDADYSKD